MKGNEELGLDALLGRWPAEEPQAKGGPSWDERADAIVAAALARKDQASDDVTEALLAPPTLPAEPGEEKAATFQLVDVSIRNETLSGAPQPMSDLPKKPSLKELAARASARGSIPPGGASTPPPARISSIPGGGATVTPLQKVASARLSDPGREDSGVLRLADLQAEEAKKAEAAAAAAEAVVAAAKEAKAAAAAAPAPVIANAPAPANNNSKAGIWAGAAIALLGVAAAFAMYRSKKPDVAPPRTDVAAITTQAAQPTSAPAQTAAPAQSAEPGAIASSDVAPAQTAAAKADPAQGVGGQGPAATATAVAVIEPKGAAAADVKTGGKVGTLDEEMKKAVGPNESQPAPQDDSKPASGSPSGNVPDQPSQGNAQAAVRAAAVAAKSCVAGATEPSMATITFGSSGSVQSVSVSGWAAANGKTACVKAAVQGAHVQPFARPTFTASATIRP